MFIIGRPRIPENLQWCSSAELRIVQGSGFRILVNVVPHPDELWLVSRLSQPPTFKCLLQLCHAHAFVLVLQHLRLELRGVGLQGLQRWLALQPVCVCVCVCVCLSVSVSVCVCVCVINVCVCFVHTHIPPPARRRIIRLRCYMRLLRVGMVMKLFPIGSCMLCPSCRACIKVRRDGMTLDARVLAADAALSRGLTAA